MFEALDDVPMVLYESAVYTLDCHLATMWKDVTNCCPYCFVLVGQTSRQSCKRKSDDYLTTAAPLESSTCNILG